MVLMVMLQLLQHQRLELVVLFVLSVMKIIIQMLKVFIHVVKELDMLVVLQQVLWMA
jgi:hypothetical protein